MKGSNPAFPVDIKVNRDGEFHHMKTCPGLTKREYIAIAAMQGFLSNPAIQKVGSGMLDETDVAEAVFKMADAMIAESEK